MRKIKVIVRAPALSASGYGEHARFLIRSLERSGLFDIYLDNINWGNLGYEPKSSDERRKLFELSNKARMYASTNKANFDMSIQVTIPNEFRKLAPYNIGVTAGIETDRISVEWVEKCNQMDKIITISEHSRKGLVETNFTVFDKETGLKKTEEINKPVSVVPYPVPQLATGCIDLDISTDFNFLVVALMGNRKNLENTVRWFVEEFHDDADVGLVMKTAIRSGCTEDKQRTHAIIQGLLEESPDRKCKVHLLHGRLTEEEKSSLYTHDKIKSLVTIAHGEGFGLPIFEAACSGLPIVAPNWSGHVDFLNHEIEDKKGKKKRKSLFSKVDYDLSPVPSSSVWEGVISPDSKWCYPKKNSFKSKMRDVYKNYGIKKALAKRLQEIVLEKYESNKVHDLFSDEVIGERLSTIDVDALPKVSIITSVYDGDEFIEKFMEEITSQSVFREKCELVLVNANSPGNEEEVIKRYQETFPENIKYFKLEEDPGIYGTWNYAIENSSGEYIMNANLDDSRHEQFIEIHAKTLSLNPDVDLVYSDAYVTRNPKDGYHNSEPLQRYSNEQFSLESMLRGNLPHNNPMWRKSVHDKHGTFEAKYKSAGDWDMWLRAAFGGSVFKKINIPLGLYYFNPTGISTDPANNEWKEKEEREVFNKYLEIYESRREK